MSTFIKGPAEGQLLMLRRAPRFLRVVVDTSLKWDALDQLEDHPAANEAIHVYEICSAPCYIHLSAKGPAGGNYITAEYRYVEPPPADSKVRDNKAWRAWCYAAAESRPSLIPQPQP